MIGLSDLARVIAPLKNMIMMLFSKAKVSGINNLGKKGAKPSVTATNPQRLYLSLLFDEVLSQVERSQDYGFESFPLPGAEAAVVFIGGRRSRGVAVSVQDHRYRPTDLAEGNVCIYDKDGARLVHKSGKVALGNKVLNIELLDLVDQLLTLLQGNVDAVGVASTGTNSLILAQLLDLQTKLGQIKGTL